MAGRAVHAGARAAGEDGEEESRDHHQRAAARGVSCASSTGGRRTPPLGHSLGAGGGRFRIFLFHFFHF